MEACHGYPLDDAGVAQIQRWYSEGVLTVRQVVSCYLARISQIDPYVKYNTPPLHDCFLNTAAFSALSWN
jgi:hypothetical protein